VRARSGRRMGKEEIEGMGVSVGVGGVSDVWTVSDVYMCDVMRGSREAKRRARMI